MPNYSTLKNQEAFFLLPDEDKRFLVEKHHKIAVKMNIERILQLKSPFSLRFYHWINKNAVNRNWYLKHMNHIKIFDDEMELFGEQITLHDRENKDENSFIWSKNDVSVSLPDRAMIVRKLPQKSRESFFLEVLEMSGKYLGSSSDMIATSKDKVVLQSALYTRGKLRRK